MTWNNVPHHDIKKYIKKRDCGVMDYIFYHDM